MLGRILASQNKHHYGKWAGAGGTGVNERAPQDSEAADSDEGITRCSFPEAVTSLIPYQMLYFVICCKRFLYDLF